MDGRRRSLPRSGSLCMPVPQPNPLPKSLCSPPLNNPEPGWVPSVVESVPPPLPPQVAAQPPGGGGAKEVGIRLLLKPRGPGFPPPLRISEDPPTPPPQRGATDHKQEAWFGYVVRLVSTAALAAGLMTPAWGEPRERCFRNTINAVRKNKKPSAIRRRKV